MKTEPLIGTVEAGEILGISKQRIHQLRAEGRFPQPAVVVGTTAFWRRADIKAFGKVRRPTGRPRKQR